MVLCCCDTRDAGSGAVLRLEKRVESSGAKWPSADGGSAKLGPRQERMVLAAGERAVGAKYSVFESMYAMPGRYVGSDRRVSRSTMGGATSSLFPRHISKLFTNSDSCNGLTVPNAM